MPRLVLELGAESDAEMYVMPSSPSLGNQRKSSRVPSEEEVVDRFFSLRRGPPRLSRYGIPDLGLQSHEKVPGHLEAQPAAGHAGGDLEQIRRDALVQALDALVGDDDAHRVPD